MFDIYLKNCHIYTTIYYMYHIYWTVGINVHLKWTIRRLPEWRKIEEKCKIKIGESEAEPK